MTETFIIENLHLQCGMTLPRASLVYETHGRLSENKDNVVVLPTFYTGSHIRNRGFFGEGRAIDPSRHFIVSINLFGNGYSSSPSNTPAPYDGPRFPEVTLYDNILAQNKLLEDLFDIEEIALGPVGQWRGANPINGQRNFPKRFGRYCHFVGQLRLLCIIMCFLKA